MGTKVYPSWSRASRMPGRASGVWMAALWNRTMEPGCTLVVTRSVISAAESSFQSRLSLSQTGSMLGVSYRLSGFCILRLHSILCSWLYAITRSPVYSKGTDRQSSGTPQACQDSKHRGSYAIVPVLSAQNPDIDFKK